MKIAIRLETALGILVKELTVELPSAVVMIKYESRFYEKVGLSLYREIEFPVVGEVPEIK